MKHQITNQTSRLFDDPKNHHARCQPLDDPSYQRGHNAAAGNYIADRELFWSTYTYVNVSTMLWHFNKGIWKLLELVMRSIASHNGTSLATGGFVKKGCKPTFLLNNSVAIPTHFWKSVLIKQKNGEFYSLSFLVPHQVKNHSKLNVLNLKFLRSSNWTHSKISLCHWKILNWKQTFNCSQM